MGMSNSAQIVLVIVSVIVFTLAWMEFGRRSCPVCEVWPIETYRYPDDSPEYERIFCPHCGHTEKRLKKPIK